MKDINTCVLQEIKKTVAKKIPGGLRKGTWTTEEDILLKKCVEKYGEGKWHQVPFRAGLNRCRKSCRLRWLNYLRPDIKRGCFTRDEIDLIIRLHKLLGNRWSLIAGRLPGRTANDVKNFWNTHIEKKFVAASASASTFFSKSNNKTSNLVKPRPWNFLNSHASNQLCNKLINISNKTEDKDANAKKIMLSPSPRMKSQMNSGSDGENANTNPPPCSSSKQEEVDECTRWWKDLLERCESPEMGSPFLFPNQDEDLRIELPVMSELLELDEYTWWNPAGGLGSLGQDDGGDQVWDPNSICFDSYDY